MKPRHHLLAAALFGALLALVSTSLGAADEAPATGSESPPATATPQAPPAPAWPGYTGTYPPYPAWGPPWMGDHRQFRQNCMERMKERWQERQNWREARDRERVNRTEHRLFHWPQTGEWEHFWRY